MNISNRNSVVQIRAVFVIFLLLYPFGVLANSLMIWPVRPVIESNADATSVWLENRSTEPLTLQVRVLDWNHGVEGPTYALQTAVISSPPLVILAPHERQLVRVYNRQPVMPGQEKSWRILIDELPSDQARHDTSGVNFQIRYSLPLFAYGPGAINPTNVPAPVLHDLVSENVNWSVQRSPDETNLLITNKSSFNWRIDTVTIHPDEGDRLVVGEGMQGYLLPSSTRQWKIPAHVSSIQAISFNVHGTELRVINNE